MNVDTTVWKKMYNEEVAKLREVCPAAIMMGDLKLDREAATDRRIMSEIWSMLNSMKGLE